MKLFHRTTHAAAGAVLCCCLTTSPVFSQSNANKPRPDSQTSATQASSKDETNSSPRERGRILIKRNPIASEYQVFGDIGSAAGADADGEGVDFRAYFPRSNPIDKPIDSLQIGYNLNFNDQSSIGKSGYSANWSKAFDTDGRFAAAFQIRNMSSDRLIEHYESVWQKRAHDGNYYIDRPRISYDDILTENTLATAQIGYKLNERNSFYFKSSNQKYTDSSYRNRIELQFASAELNDGSEVISEDNSATEATFANARSRRYFGDTENDRSRHHNTFGGTYTGDAWTVDYAVYTQKWDLDRLWHNWNFRESGLDVAYEVEDPYTPKFTQLGETDLLDQSKAGFSSLRIHNSYTRDRDIAFRVDAERPVTLGDKVLWIQTGLLHREKEREAWQDLEVYDPSPDAPLALSDIAFEGPEITILDGFYTQPTGLDPQKGRDILTSNPEHFVFNEFRTTVENAPQSYDANEEVSSAYLLGTQELGKWTVEAGARFEQTKTATRGRVVIPEAVNDPEEGELLYTIETPYDGSLLIVKDLYSQNTYDNIIPSTEVSYEADEKNTFKAAWFQLLMRPQYFNIVDYRRISVPTRSVSEGNPELLPTEIDKLRLSWTHKHDTLGTLSLEGYFIDIENFFYGSVSDEEILEDGTPATYRVSRVENGESARIKGIEVQWKKTASEFLFFDRSSTTVAYTLSDSEAYVQSRPEDDLPTPERSDHLLKLSLAGTIGKLSNTVDFTYQSKALDDLGSSIDQDEYRKAVVGLSFRSAYSLNQKTSLSLNFANLTDHPERSYEGSPLRVSRNQYSSWFATFSLNRSL
ncbi:outer membrane beta-barrel protein [Pelagicoccus mobilis]|uniref:Outer membrane beta-barrel protein n=1 Tax=Pelagicoccus mobilis TaxID=415221 RepID=A0A934RV40_9BACT|nr:outer membrane beta-barrel protein [Pelagicoccus mobilis]MBK1876958.1 outer membrane beta-barrel protein [Pelagicoccus mobilis]